MSALTAELNGMKKALKVGDIAALLNVSRGQIYKLVDEGRLPAIRLGTSIRFDPGAVASWIDRQRTL